MNTKAVAVSGFLSFITTQLMSVISGFFLGRFDAMPADKVVMMSAMVVAMVGLFGIIVSLVFSKVEQSIPLPSLITKALFFFCCFHLFSTATTQGIKGLWGVDFALSSLFTVVGALLFVWLYGRLNHRFAVAD